MTPEEARRLVAVEEQAQRDRMTGYHAQVFPPYWVQGYKTIAGTAYALGPAHGPKMTWPMIRARAAERREEAKYCAAAGWTVPTIARHLGVSVPTVRKYLAPPPPPTPLWRLPRATRRAERAKRRRLGMLAWAASRPPLRVFADNALTDPGFIAAYHAKYTPGFPTDGG